MQPLILQPGSTCSIVTQTMLAHHLRRRSPLLQSRMKRKRLKKFLRQVALSQLVKPLEMVEKMLPLTVKEEEEAADEEIRIGENVAEGATVLMEKVEKATEEIAEKEGIADGEAEAIEGPEPRNQLIKMMKASRSLETKTREADVAEEAEAEVIGEEIEEIEVMEVAEEAADSEIEVTEDLEEEEKDLQLKMGMPKHQPMATPEMHLLNENLTKSYSCFKLMQ